MTCREEIEEYINNNGVRYNLWDMHYMLADKVDRLEKNKEDKEVVYG